MPWIGGAPVSAHGAMTLAAKTVRACVRATNGVTDTAQMDAEFRSVVLARGTVTLRIVLGAFIHYAFLIFP